MLLAKVPRRRCHDRPLADYNFAPLPDRQPDVFFAYEVGGLFDSSPFDRRRLLGWPAWAGTRLARRFPSAAPGLRAGVPARREELVDPPRERLGRDTRRRAALAATFGSDAGPALRLEAVASGRGELAPGTSPTRAA